MPLLFAASNDEFLALSDITDHKSTGAKVTFVGCVRPVNHHKQVSFLDYEAHVPLAMSMFADLEAEMVRRFHVLKSLAVHRLKRVDVGQDSVTIKVLAGHRHEAFMAARFLMDELKRTLPIWRKEVYSDGTYTWDQMACHEARELSDQVMMQPVRQALIAKRITPLDLGEKRVVLVGAGGLGCPLAINLCALGLRHLAIIDGDTVSLSNLARQFAYRLCDQGAKKVGLLKQFIEERYYSMSLSVYEEFVDEVKALSFFHEADLVIDATDCPLTKNMLKKMAFKESRPVISASVHQHDGEVQVFIPKSGGCLNCFLPGTYVNRDSCASTGVLTHVCQMVAAVATDKALALLANISTISSEISIIDLKGGVRSFTIARDEHCITCGDLSSLKPKKKLVEIMR